MKAKRARGVMVTESVEPTWGLAEEAKKIQRQKQEERAARAERRANTAPPNWRCYPMLFKVGVNIDANGNWLGGKLPPCKVCEGIIHPQENHVCDGFRAKYVEHDDEWHERQEYKREYARAIVEGRREDIREARREMIREARLNGGLYGMEDDGHEDDDGWECEDDGVYGDDDGWDCD